jgi:hypothetical protein
MNAGRAAAVRRCAGVQLQMHGQQHNNFSALGAAAAYTASETAPDVRP